MSFQDEIKSFDQRWSNRIVWWRFHLFNFASIWSFQLHLEERHFSSLNINNSPRESEAEREEKEEKRCSAILSFYFHSEKEKKNRVRAQRESERVVRVILVVSEEQRTIKVEQQSVPCLEQKHDPIGKFIGLKKHSQRRTGAKSSSHCWSLTNESSRDKNKLPKLQFNQRSVFLLIWANETNGDVVLSALFSSSLSLSFSVSCSLCFELDKIN